MSPDMHKKQEAFLASVADCWGLKTMIKDPGEDILNLVPDPTNNDQ